MKVLSPWFRTYQPRFIVLSGAHGHLTVSIEEAHQVKLNHLNL